MSHVVHMHVMFCPLCGGSTIFCPLCGGSRIAFFFARVRCAPCARQSWPEDWLLFVSPGSANNIVNSEKTEKDGEIFFSSPHLLEVSDWKPLSPIFWECFNKLKKTEVQVVFLMLDMLLSRH